MEEFHTWRKVTLSDLNVLLLIGLAGILLHVLTSNGQYGFHRDELFMLDNARHLDWGYVAYPPLTPWIVRAGLALFGPSWSDCGSRLPLRRAPQWCWQA